MSALTVLKGRGGRLQAIDFETDSLNLQNYTPVGVVVGVVHDSVVVEVDMLVEEAKVVARLALENALLEICKRAGCKMSRERRIDHIFFAHLETQPPRMQWVGRDGKLMPNAPRQKRRERRVIVGAEWLRTREPELWAAFVSARILGLPTLQLAPTWGDNNKRI